MIVICGWKLMWCTSSCSAPRSRMQKVSKPPDYLQTHHPRLWLLAAKLQVVCVCQIFHPTSKPVITDRFQRSTEKNNCVCSGATCRAELSWTFQREKQVRLLLMEFDSRCLHLLLICLVEIGGWLEQLSERTSVLETLSMVLCSCSASKWDTVVAVHLFSR